jgi:hypothetical protein
MNTRNAAAAHPHAKLRDPMSLRIYDLVAMGSIPGMSFRQFNAHDVYDMYADNTCHSALLIYFLFYAPGGDKSDALVVSNNV